MTQYATGSPPAFTANPFDTAALEVAAARTFVQTQIGYVKDTILGPSSFNAIAQLNEQLDRLNDFEVNIPQDIQYLEPTIDTDLILHWDAGTIDTSTFGSISPLPPGGPPGHSPFPEIDDPDIFPFEPSITGITVPPPPGMAPITEPGPAPGNPGFSYPEPDPVILPNSPTLSAIQIPAPPEIELPTLDLLDFPGFQELNIDTLIPWTEPVYQPEIWMDTKNQIQIFLNGGTGIRPDVEEAIVNRGRDREDRIIRQEVQQTLEEWADRGYTVPPGMLVKRIDVIREQGSLKKLGLQREVVIKAMDAELENLRFAVQQGIVAEGLFIQLHLAAVERMFLVQRLHIEWMIQLYNISVEIYKAKLQENVVRAQVYEVQVRAALAEIEVFKALIEAELAKATVNKVLVEAYIAEIEARKTLVDIYVAQVQAVKIQADVYATDMVAYKTEIEAFATRVEAEKIKFQAYETQIRGESIKADIIEAEARAYQANMSGIETGTRAQVAALEGAVAGFRADIDAFQSLVQYYATLNQNELAQIQAHVAGHAAETQQYVAENQVKSDALRLEATMWEAGNRIAVETFRAEIERLRLIMEKAVQEAGLMLEATKASGELTSTISAGALAALHVGATSSGSGSVGASGGQNLTHQQSESYSKDCSTSQNTSISYEAESMPGYFCGFDP
jgi:hypothetical protein